MSQQDGSEALVRTSPASVADALSSIINVSEGGVYWEPTCLFCTSRYRIQAEELWLSKDIMAKDPESRIVAFFDTNGENVSSDAVSNHVKNHMRRGDVELRKMEYIGRLATLSSLELSVPSQIKLAIAAIIECITSSAEIGPTKRMSAAKAQEIRARIINSLVKSWADLLAQKSKLEGEMEEKGEVISFPKEGFRRVFDDALTAIRTEEDKILINSIMEALMDL